MRKCEFESWKAFSDFLETDPVLEANWYDGFAAGVDDPRYDAGEDGATDQPWCAPWDWDAWSDQFDFAGEQLDWLGRPTPDAVYDFAKSYAASLRADIIEALDEDEANRKADKEQEA